MPSFVDITGQKFGRWTAIERVGTKAGGALWKAICDCGNKGEVRSNALRSGTSRSCGCLNADVHRDVCIKRNTTHGNAKRSGYTPTYSIWINLFTRKYHKKYEGVTICERWKSFENFLADMGDRPSLMHSIDRIDNGKWYEPSNCRWATMKEQQNNRTNNRKIAAFGKIQNLQQWASEYEIDRKTISSRLNRGWSPETAISEPAVKGRNQSWGRSL